MLFSTQIDKIRARGPPQPGNRMFFPCRRDTAGGSSGARDGSNYINCHRFLLLGWWYKFVRPSQIWLAIFRCRKHARSAVMHIRRWQKRPWEEDPRTRRFESGDTFTLCFCNREIDVLWHFSRQQLSSSNHLPWVSKSSPTNFWTIFPHKRKF